MTRLTAYVLALLLCAVPAAAQLPGLPGPPAGQVPPRDTVAPKVGTAIIRGRVVAGDNGQALRKAQVRLSGADLRDSRLASTGADGRYEFTDLPAGRYTLTAGKGSYVSLQYGQLRAFEAGRPVDIRDGQTLETIDFALPRGGVIAGRVLDEFGEPVMDVQVSAMRYQYQGGRKRLAPAGRVGTTNDIGEFRVFGLSPGQYYVSATLRDSMITMLSTGVLPDVSTSGSGYAPTYYPNTTRIIEAQHVTVGVGQTINDILIALSPTRTARISGNVVDSQGKVVTAGAVMAMPKGEISAMSMAPTQLRSDGTFTFTGLTPGEYTLMAVAGNPLGGNIEFATASVTMTGADVTGVQLSGTKPVSGKGHIVVDPEAAKSLPLSALNLVTIPADPDALPLSAAMPAKINEDYSFELKVQPGKALVRLGGAAGAFAIRAVRYDGQDVTDSGIEFKPDEEVRDIEIELTNQATTVTGGVADARGQPAKDYSVIVFSQDRERWTPTTRRVALGRPDQEGKFRARVPAGNYFAVALDYTEPGEQFDPDFLDRLRPLAVTFSIMQAETKTMDLKLTPHP